MKKIILFVLIIIIVLLPLSLAHKGRTDSNGGHYDSSTGEYHYHHGYSAHRHINGLCPYEDDLDDLLPSKCPECNSIVNAENGWYCFECGNELLHISNMMKVVDGDANKTRSEYFKEVQDLKGELEEKENIINGLMTSSNELENQLEQTGFNSIEELDNKINELEADISNMWFWFFVVVIAVMIIFYNIGSKTSENANNENKS